MWSRWWRRGERLLPVSDLPCATWRSVQEWPGGNTKEEPLTSLRWIDELTMLGELGGLFLGLQVHLETGSSIGLDLFCNVINLVDLLACRRT